MSQSADAAVANEATRGTGVQGSMDTTEGYPAPQTVLVVEDNESERWRLTAMLGKLGYRVVDASNGNEALVLQSLERADIVVSDWRMPGMDGLELCRTLKSDPAYGQPFFVMLTAMNNPVDLVAGMEAGADDFVSKPCAAEELRVRVQAGARIQSLRARLEDNNEAMEHMLQRERETVERMRGDLDMAAELQRSLLPAAAARLEDFTLGTLFQPAEEIGGDFFNYFRLGPEHLGFYLLDVSGHGVAAAMLAFSISYQFNGDVAGNRMLMEDGPDGPRPAEPASVVAALNEQFQDRDGSGRFFTMVYGVINVRTGAGRFCQAGHPYPLVLRANGEGECLGDGGHPAGMFPGAVFENVDFRLAPGDRLMICSDGVLDYLAGKDSSIVYPMLTRRLGDSAGSTAAEMVRVMEKVLGEQRSRGVPEDDISVLAIARAAAE